MLAYLGTYFIFLHIPHLASVGNLNYMEKMLLGLNTRPLLIIARSNGLCLNLTEKDTTS